MLRSDPTPRVIAGAIALIGGLIALVLAVVVVLEGDVLSAVVLTVSAAIVIGIGAGVAATGEREGPDDAPLDCPACGYALLHEQARCPECGAPRPEGPSEAQALGPPEGT